MVYLTYTDLAFSSLFLLIAGILSVYMRLGTGKSMAVASVRMVIQLLLLGLILKAIFSFASFWIVLLITLVMIGAAGYEINSRQKYRFRGLGTFLIAAVPVGVFVYAISFITLVFIVSKKPWYTPQYAIPLIGIMLGNAMNGVAIGLERLSSAVVERKKIIETRLMLGHTPEKAVSNIKKESIKSGMIPLINSMSATGIVTLPGMMTGQILAGAPPVEAVKYQILIMFLISACSALGTICSVTIASRRFFDSRERLRLERLKDRK